MQRLVQEMTNQIDRRHFLSAASSTIALQSMSRSSFANIVGRSKSNSVFSSRSVFSQSVRSGFNIDHGAVYLAGGFQYLGVNNSNVIPDIPGVIPFGKIFPQHFGAKADMLYKMMRTPRGHGGGASGFVLSSGANDRLAIHKADAYANVIGQPLYFKGNYLVDGELWPSVRWVSEIEWGATMWLRYYWDSINQRIPECGLRLTRSGTGLIGIRLIGQNATTQLRPSGNGHLGTLFTIGDYYSSKPQALIENIALKVLMVRAAHIPGAQISTPGFLSAAMGYIENMRAEIGVWGKTNVSSTAPFFFHWGAHYKSPDGEESLDKTAYEIIETYHTVGAKLTWLTPLDNNDGHNFSRSFDLASVGDVEVGPLVAKGVPAGAGWITCGDVCDFYTSRRQAGAIGKGIRLGFIDASDCPLSRSGPRSSAFFLKGRGESKAKNDVYKGTDILKSRQLVWDIKCDGFKD